MQHSFRIIEGECLLCGTTITWGVEASRESAFSPFSSVHHTDSDQIDLKRALYETEPHSVPSADP